MNSYSDAQKVITTARDKVSKPLGNNTYVEDLGDRLAVRLHHTYVVTYYPDGSIVLNSGGWRTKVTKDRMNEYLPNDWHVHQECGVWYLVHRLHCGGWYGLSEKEYIFHDGIRIGPRGGCSGKRRKKKTK